jgi:hypothetical protein
MPAMVMERNPGVKKPKNESPSDSILKHEYFNRGVVGGFGEVAVLARGALAKELILSEKGSVQQDPSSSRRKSVVGIPQDDRDAVGPPAAYKKYGLRSLINAARAKFAVLNTGCADALPFK